MNKDFTLQIELIATLTQRLICTLNNKYEDKQEVTTHVVRSVAEPEQAAVLAIKFLHLC